MENISIRSRRLAASYFSLRTKSPEKAHAFLANAVNYASSKYGYYLPALSKHVGISKATLYRWLGEVTCKPRVDSLSAFEANVDWSDFTF